MSLKYSQPLTEKRFVHLPVTKFTNISKKNKHLTSSQQEKQPINITPDEFLTLVCITENKSESMLVCRRKSITTWDPWVNFTALQTDYFSVLAERRL